ncbi:phage virion morphogenesis protein, partial [Serratia bockelmannii]|uniref:phage virion morphogenesis protein n=1 Tax=Serratia bockelmannii TaxID=2703793 RepID=UPI003FA6959A
MSDAGLFLELDALLASVVTQLTPVNRRVLTRELATGLRSRQAKRIAKQQNPDGSPYEPKKERRVKTWIGSVRFLWNNGHGHQVREISNWHNTKGSRGEPMITGYDAEAGGARSFKREDIERYLSIDLNKSAIRRSLRKNAMFQRIRAYRYLRATSGADTAQVGFDGRVAAIARIHQFGLTDTLATHIHAKYPAR